MLLGILSDTHDQSARTAAAVELLRTAGAETLIHCGNLTNAAVVRACGVMPAYFVFGNNDDDNVPALREAIDAVGGVCLEWAGEVTLAGKRIAVAHGHMHTDIRRLLAARPDYLLSGHSHVASDERIGPTRRINPGALHRAAAFTVALLNLQTDTLQFLNVPRGSKN